MKYREQEPLAHLGDIPAMGANRYGGKDALVYGDETVSFRELEARSNAIANGLTADGVTPGDRIGVYMDNNLDTVPVLFGIIKSGAVPVPVNYRLDPGQQTYVLSDSGADRMFASRGSLSDSMLDTTVLFLNDAESLHDAADLERVYVPGGADHEGMVDFETWVADQATSYDPPDADLDDVALQCYTSGTTGRPKGVHTSHRNVLSALDTLHLFDPVDPQRSTVLTVVPMFHVFGITGTTLPMLYGGGTVVLRNFPVVEDLLEEINDHGVTSFYAVPAIFLQMAQEVEANPDAYDLSSIETLGSGAAPLTGDTRDRVEAAFGARLVEGWGMTETTSGAASDTYRGVEKDVGCVGQPLPDFEFKLVDPDTRETHVSPPHLDPGTPSSAHDYEPDFEDEASHTGEIAVRGPQVFEGYHNLPEKTAEVLDDDGWFYTGDIARVDKERHLWIIDRADNMMIVGGENVYPTEVEEPLHDHEAIEQAAVVAAPHEVKGEAPVAFVILEDGYEAGSDVTEAEVREFSLKRVPRYAHPRRVFFVDDIPVSGTQKVKRFELKERAEELLNGGQLESSERL